MSSFIIEARSPVYQRIGIIENYTSFEAIVRHNAVGTWSLTIPGGTPEIAHLQPGNGIIVRIGGQDEIAFSGPITKISRSWGDDELGAGLVVVSGVTDDQLLYERVTYPVPGVDLEGQTDDRYILVSNAGNIMEALVSENCGPDALSSRQYPQLDIESGTLIGSPATVSTRFDVLGEVLQELANTQGIGFRVQQGANDRLLFDMYEPQDKRNLVFGREYGNLQAYSYDIEAPIATRVIFACQGEGKDRYFQDATHHPEVVEKFDDRDSRIVYGGDTVQQSESTAWRGTQTQLNLNATAEFNFTGTGIEIYGMGLPAEVSEIYVYIDDVPQSAFVPAGTETRILVAEVHNLDYGPHSVDIAARNGFTLDYVEVLDERDPTDWRRNSERFYDRRDIPVAWNAAHDALVDPGELDGSGNPLPANPSIYTPILDQAELEAWEENGPRATLSMTPIDTESVMYGRDYRVGDVVSVDIDGTVFSDILREVRLTDNDEGPRVSPVIGDSQASSTPNLYRTVRRLWSKLRKLEAQ